MVGAVGGKSPILGGKGGGEKHYEEAVDKQTETKSPDWVETQPQLDERDKKRSPYWVETQPQLGERDKKRSPDCVKLTG